MSYLIISQGEFLEGLSLEERNLAFCMDIDFAKKFDTLMDAENAFGTIKDVNPLRSSYIIPYLEVNKEGITLKDDVELQKIAASLESYRLAVNYAVGAEIITSIEYLEDEKHCEWVHVHYGTSGLIEVNVNIDSPQAVLKDVQQAISDKGLI